MTIIMSEDKKYCSGLSDDVCIIFCELQRRQGLGKKVWDSTLEQNLECYKRVSKKHEEFNCKLGGYPHSPLKGPNIRHSR